MVHNHDDNNDNPKSDRSSSVFPRGLVDYALDMSPMSLVGLQERTFHYQDLAHHLQQQSSCSANNGDSYKRTSPFASLPATRPGQDPSDAFHQHLLSVLGDALRIVNEQH